MKERTTWMFWGIFSMLTLLYLAGNGTVGLWDRDEPRYAQTSRQMMQSGDWIVPRFLDNVRTAKPVFIYWLQAASMKVFGDYDWSARFPSVVAMLVLIFILWEVGRRTVGAERSFWTVFILGTSGIVIMSAKMCLTDAVLLLFITIAQLCLFAIWQGQRSWWVVLTMWAAIALAGLTKGPVILGVMLTTLLVLWILRGTVKPITVNSEPRGFPVVTASPEAAPLPESGPVETAPIIDPLPAPAPAKAPPPLWKSMLVGLVLFVVLVAPWLILIKMKAPAFLEKSASHDVWTRILKPLEGHGGPPGYHFVLLWGTYFPWSILLPITFVSAWKNRRIPLVRFALAATIGPWVMMEIVRTKLPHYVLPIFPALAFLSADALVRAFRKQHTGLTNKVAVGGIAVWAVIVCIVGLGPWILLKWYPTSTKWPMVGVSLAAIAFAFSVYWNFHLRDVRRAAWTMGLGMAALFYVLYCGWIPNTQSLRLSQNTADDLILLGVTKPDSVRMLDYMEPSLAFYQGGTMREGGPYWFRTQDLDALPQYLVLTRQLWDKATPDCRERYEHVSSRYGLMYADRGRRVELMIVRKKA